MKAQITALLAVTLGLATCMPLRSSAIVPSGAKDLFVSQLNANGAPTNLGLAYSIELHRNGKMYKVDNRFPFQSGDQIRFHVRPNVDGFMYIVLESPGGSKMLMFPRPGDEKNEVTKGKSMTMPEKGLLTFDEVPGVESLKLVLSSKPLEVKPDRPEPVIIGQKSIVITEKKNTALPKHFLIDFTALDAALKEPPKAVTEKDFEDGPNAASTLVSTEIAKPLVVDLMLKHKGRGGLPIASGAHLPTLPTRDQVIDDGSSTQVSVVDDNNNSRAEAAVRSAVNGASPVSDKWAVVIGISQFKNPRWNLKYPDKDAKDFAGFLVKKCNFAPDHVRVLTDASATRERILTDIGSYWLPYNAKPNDLVCIYFATHGTAPALDVAHKNFLMAYDTDPINPFATGIEINDLARNVVRRLKSQRVVLILDTCHSGAAEIGAKDLNVNKFDMTDLLQGTGHVVIASAGASQTAHDSARYQNGIFTHHLMEGLLKYPTLSGAFEYTKKQVQTESAADYKDVQTPVLKDAEWKGLELKLSVPPIAPRKPLTSPPV